MTEVKKHLKVIFTTTTLAQYIGVEEAMFGIWVENQILIQVDIPNVW